MSHVHRKVEFGGIPSVLRGCDGSGRRASITSTWEPVMAGVTAYLVLGEVLYPLQMTGGVAVIVAVILLQIAKEKGAPPAAFDIRHKGKK